MDDEEGVEPIVSDEERIEVLKHLRDQFNETVDDYMSDGKVRGADAVEAVMDLALKVLSTVANPTLAGILAIGGPMVKNMLVGAAGKSDAKRETPEAIRLRAVRMRDTAAEHVKKADKLEDTPKKEFLEKMRIRHHRSRAKGLLEEARLLEASIPA